MVEINSTTELRKEYNDQIIKTIIAFANTDGGKIYTGVRSDGRVCGVKNPHEIVKRIEQLIDSAVRPSLTKMCECRILKKGKKTVIKLTVQRGPFRPYALSSVQGMAEGVYIRKDTSDVLASEKDVLQLLKATKIESYEEARSPIQRLTFTSFEESLKKNDIKYDRSELKSMGIIGEDDMYTNLGLWMSDQCDVAIKLAVFEGDKKKTFRDRIRLNGSLLKQLEDAYDYINRHNSVKAQVDGLYRVDTKGYPADAVREALLNAIVHRDYEIKGPTLINIYDNKIEFVNVGGQVSGMTVADMTLGISDLRNKKLADVFYCLNLIEAYGTGISKIFNSYDDSEEKPSIEITGNVFKVTLPNKNIISNGEKDGYVIGSDLNNDAYNSPVNDERDKKIMSLFDKSESFTRKDVEDILECSQATAILAIRKMLQEKRIRKVNTGKYSRYVKY